MMNFIIFFIISALFWTSIVSKDCLPSKITGVTTFKNGTVFVASDQLYWLLDINTLKPITNHSKGLVKDLIPGMSSVQMAVSLRTSFDGSSTETLLFQTFEENHNKYMVYRNMKWEDGLPLMHNITEIAFNGGLPLNVTEKKRIVLIYFKKNSYPFVYVIFGKTGVALSVHEKWSKYFDFNDEFNELMNKTSDSLWIKNPDNDSMSYLTFVGRQYLKCNSSGSFPFTKVVCESAKNMNELIECLPPINSKKESGHPLAQNKEHGFKVALIVAVIIFLILSFIVMVVIIIVYCKCLKAVIADETEKEKTNANEKSIPQNKSPNNESKAKETPHKSTVVSEISRTEKKDLNIRTGNEMSERVNQIKDILEKNDKKETQKQESKEKKSRHKPNDANKEEKREKSAEKRTFVGKDSKKFQNTVQEIGKMLAEGPKKTQKVSNTAYEEPVSETKAKRVAKQTRAQSQVLQTSDDRLKQLLSKTTANEEDARVDQLMSTTGGPSKQQDSRVDKLLKE